VTRSCSGGSSLYELVNPLDELPVRLVSLLGQTRSCPFVEFSNATSPLPTIHSRYRLNTS